jgi:F-type H+-transporting ATPase subunit c
MDNRRVTVFAICLMIGLAHLGSFHQSASAQAERSPANVAASPVPTASNDSRINAEPKGVDNLGLVALGSIVIAGLTIALGSIAPALGEGRAVAQALSAIAQQPDSSNTITRTLFVGLAMIESTAIYCFVVSMILLFANPFWNHFIQ